VYVCVPVCVCARGCFVDMVLNLRQSVCLHLRVLFHMILSSKVSYVYICMHTCTYIYINNTVLNLQQSICLCLHVLFNLVCMCVCVQRARERECVRACVGICVCVSVEDKEHCYDSKTNNFCCDSHQTRIFATILNLQHLVCVRVCVCVRAYLTKTKNFATILM